MNQVLGSRPDSDDGLWLTAYADLISAVLAVVVLMLTFSPIKLEGMIAEVFTSINSKTEPLTSLSARLEEVTEALNLTDKVRIELDHRGLRLLLGTVSLFESGSSEINPESAARFIPLLQEIAEAANYRHIDIEGHSDDVGTAVSKWRLSMERAHAIRRYLELLGIPDEGLRLIALGDTEPLVEPGKLAGQSLDDARRANRRVVLRIHNQRPTSER